MITVDESHIDSRYSRQRIMAERAVQYKRCYFTSFELRLGIDTVNNGAMLNAIVDELVRHRTRQGAYLHDDLRPQRLQCGCYHCFKEPVHEPNSPSTEIEDLLCPDAMGGEHPTTRRSSN
jgi:Zn finger protein HypA/HybF involved in hydrogenase expression